MSRVLVWDLPTRMFHWLLAGGFVAAAVIALLLGEDSRIFPYHGIIGLTIGLLVCLRMVWGVIGTRYARFGTFVYGPRAVVEYMKGALLGGGKRYIGHNPGSAAAIWALLILVLAMAVTGVMLGRGNKAVKELHEVLSSITVGVAIVHVLGVALHTIRHRENLTASMIHGRKEAEPSEGIASARPLAGALLLAVTGAWIGGLVRNLDPATQTTKVPLIGATLQLGENEREGGAESGRRKRKLHDDDE